MLNLAYVIFGEHFDPLKQKNFAFKNIFENCMRCWYFIHVQQIYHKCKKITI